MRFGRCGATVRSRRFRVTVRSGSESESVHGVHSTKRDTGGEQGTKEGSEQRSVFFSLLWRAEDKLLEGSCSAQPHDCGSRAPSRREECEQP